MDRVVTLAGLPAGSSVIVLPLRARADAPLCPRSAAVSFSTTVYRNSRARGPACESYTARRSVPPVSRSRYGVPPETLADTSSENATVTLIAAPIPCGPAPSGDETRATEGRTPSTTTRLDAPSEPGSPRAGRVRLAAFPGASAMPEPDMALLAL